MKKISRDFQEVELRLLKFYFMNNVVNQLKHLEAEMFWYSRWSGIKAMYNSFLICVKKRCKHQDSKQYV